MNSMFLKFILILFVLFSIGFAGAIGKQFSSILILPSIFIFLSYYVFKYLTKGKMTFITYAIIIQFAHILWMSISVIILYFSNYVSSLNSLYIDLLIVTIGLLWLYFKMGMAPIIYMTIYQVFSIVMNIMAFHMQTAALILHLSFRIASIVLMIYGYLDFKKLKHNEASF